MNKKGEQKHILVLRFSALGDVAMSVPVLIALTRKYPELKLTVVSRGFHRHLFIGIENVEFFEAKLSSDHKGFFGLWRLYKELKQQKIDAVADIHNVLRSKVLKSFFVLGGKKVIQLDKGRSDKRKLTNANGKTIRPLKTMHERYAKVFDKLGFPVELGKGDILSKIPLSEKVFQLTCNEGKKHIGIAPFAAHSGKMYPLSKMKNVIADLAKTNQYKIYLFGGGKDEEVQLKAIQKNNQNVISIPGNLDFGEELELISNLDLMVSMDSANGHLAANYGVSVMTLWGVTHPFAGFFPFQQPKENWLLADREKFPLIPTSVYGNKVPKGYENAMDTISEAEVLNKLMEILTNN